jgi:hypothetical protein
MEQNYFITKEQYQAVKQAWKSRYDHTSWEVVVYNALRSKPIRNGFVERGRNIQGCNPWYAFKLALQDAQRSISTKNPYTNPRLQNPDAPLNNSFENAEKRINVSKAAFKKTFGIDIPDGFMELLKDE